MNRTVIAFNTLTGHTLTETQGWLFMAVLKLSRALGGAFNRDDLLDGAAYMALALERELAVDELASRATPATINPSVSSCEPLQAILSGLPSYPTLLTKESPVHPVESPETAPRVLA